MAEIEKLFFDKDWNNPEDFPTVEPDEIQARKDMQYLFDQIKTYINSTLVPAIPTEDEEDEDAPVMVADVRVNADGELEVVMSDGEVKALGEIGGGGSSDSGGSSGSATDTTHILCDGTSNVRDDLVYALSDATTSQKVLMHSGYRRFGNVVHLWMRVNFKVAEQTSSVTLKLHEVPRPAQAGFHGPSTIVPWGYFDGGGMVGNVYTNDGSPEGWASVYIQSMNDGANITGLTIDTGLSGKKFDPSQYVGLNFNLVYITRD